MSKMQKHANKNTLQALEQIESKARSHVPSANEPPSESASELPPVQVAFSIEKRVGDARITAYGQAGQELEARNKVNETVKSLKK